MSNNTNHNIYYRNNDDFELSEFLTSLKRTWLKTVVSILTIFTLFAILIFLIPKVYQSKVLISQPDYSVSVELNRDTVEPLSIQQIFKIYYDAARSRDNFNLFLNEIASSSDIMNNEKVRKEILKSFTAVIVEPKGDADEFITIPSLFSMAINSKNEEFSTSAINQYVHFANSKALKSIFDDQVALKTSAIEKTEREIKLLELDALERRQIQIQRIESENSIQIEQINEKIKALELKAKLDRNSEISQLSDALVLAKSLGIKYPTKVDELSPDKASVATNISLDTNQNLPLYLMGTEYLSKRMELLKGRESDRSYITEINELERQRLLLENDSRLASLKSRENDLVFTDSYSAKLAELERLNSINVSPASLNLFKIQESAFPTGESVKPKRGLLLAFAFVLSFVGVMIVLFLKAYLAHREKLKESRENGR